MLNIINSFYNTLGVILASILIIRNSLTHICISSDYLYNEHINLPIDKHCKIRGRIISRKSLYNLELNLNVYKSSGIDWLSRSKFTIRNVKNI